MKWAGPKWIRRSRKSSVVAASMTAARIHRAAATICNANARASSSILFQVAFERAQRRIPKRSNFLELLNQRFNLRMPARCELVDALATDLLGPDETGAAQHPRVFDDGGPADRKSMSQFSRATRFLCETPQQFSASGVAQRHDGSIYRH